MNAYEILECESSISNEELKQQYHKLILKYHPDKSNNNCVVKFIQIQAAYSLLRNQESRLNYDIYLKQIELENKAMSDDQPLSVSKDFELNNDYYCRKCHRCGGEFIITLNDYISLLSSVDATNKTSVFVNLQCDSCSLCLNTFLF